MTIPQEDLHWIERGFEGTRVPRWLASLVIGLMAYLIYQFFGIFVSGTFGGVNRITISFTCILIAVLLFGIQFFLGEIRARFARLEVCPERESKCISPIDLLLEHFNESRGFYVLVMVAFLPFIAIKINALYSGYTPFFYLAERTSWALFLDIYNEFLNYFILYLIALLLWAMFNISWVLSKIDNEIYYENLKIYPLNSDKIGGLKDIRDLILMLSLYLSFIIILSIFTYLTPRGPLLYENISLAAFWLIGVVFSTMSWFALRKLLKRKIEQDMSSLDEALEVKREQLIDLITNKKEPEKEDQINVLSEALDIIDKERNRIIGFGINPIDARTVILFISSSFISLITLVTTIESALSVAQKSKIIMFAVNKSQPFIGDSISSFLRYFSN